MKLRISIVVLTVILMFSLVSCADSTRNFELTEFTGTVTVSYNGKEYKGILEYGSYDNIIFTLTYPENMKDIVAVYDGNDINFLFDDLSLSGSKLTAAADVYTPLFKALSFIASSEMKISKEGEDTLVFGEEKINVTVLCNEMLIASIESCGISYYFQYC